MRVVIDIEANALENPTKIWLIVCKDIDTGKVYIFRNVTENPTEFLSFANDITWIIGHNLLGYDVPVLHNLIGLSIPNTWESSTDTLIISKMVEYGRPGGHSVEQYGLEFGLPKGDNHHIAFFTKWSQELEDYCIRDVEITHKIYDKYKRFINNVDYRAAIALEHRFQLVVNDLHDNGFAFNRTKAQGLLDKVSKELEKLDKDILDAFPPRDTVVRTFVPRLTKHGTISRTSVPRSLHDQIHTYQAGKEYQLTRKEVFNPASHKQIIDVLTEAGWSPLDKTKTHIDAERELNILKRNKSNEPEVDVRLQSLYNDLYKLKRYGWKINEANLATLPPSAPPSARLLAKRILLEARRRTLTEWLGLVQPDDRIHGKFYAIGTWTHRMAHQQPNTANIPNELDTFGNKKLLGKEMRSLWCAPKNRLLVGVDAEGIQLRIFAHYIDDKEFTDALVKGRKDDKSDPHSLNQRILGSVCKSRQAAKRFAYALLLGAGIGKLAEILGCSEPEAREALDRLLERYTGFAYLKESVIPKDARRGYFLGLDGRPVRIPGDTEGSKRHLAMSGYLQNGEAVCMKLATLKWCDWLKEVDAKLVNFVHDEWQVECPNNMQIALDIAKRMADSLREVGEDLKLKCPLAGSYYSEDLKDYTIATNWSYTH